WHSCIGARSQRIVAVVVVATLAELSSSAASRQRSTETGGTAAPWIQCGVVGGVVGVVGVVLVLLSIQLLVRVQMNVTVLPANCWLPKEKCNPNIGYQQCRLE
ncbi:unnamed protein product, partial [Polarella glacialis]